MGGAIATTTIGLVHGLTLPRVQIIEDPDVETRRGRVVQTNTKRSTFAVKPLIEVVYVTTLGSTSLCCIALNA